MITPFELLPGPQRTLLEHARDVRMRAYAPYSNFLVGAAVQTRTGKQYLGANFENASYGLSLCAEATSLGQAVSAGDFDVSMIAIVGGPKSGPVGPVPPCGRCRQLLAEAAAVSGTDVLVLASDPTLNQALVLPISVLLPHCFALPPE